MSRAGNQATMDRLRKKLKKQVEKAGNKAVAKLYQLIIVNTNEGIDANNRPFAPYSLDYLAIRAEKGRGSRVNLQMTSSMINSLKINHRKGSLVWYIKPSGTGSDGVSNTLKLYKLQNARKKRIMLQNTKYLESEFEKFMIEMM